MRLNSHAFHSSDRRSLRPHDDGTTADGADIQQDIIVKGFYIVQPFRSGRPPESDTCRQILGEKLGAKTNLTIERPQTLGLYELNQKNETRYFGGFCTF